MKNFTSTYLRPLIAHTLRGSLAGFIGWYSISANTIAAEKSPDLSSQISASSIFYQNLTWIGSTPPTESENRVLWTDIQNMHARGVGPSLPGLEKFIADHPDSPWVPSVRANLGRYYREHGRYTKALQHWEAAWSATHTAKDGAAKSIADFTFAYWTRLLGSLGRVDALRSLFTETQNRIFDAGPLQQIINGTKEGYREMLADPGDCFKCGTFALINVAKALKGISFDPQPIDSVPSPVTGFNMTKLEELAQQSSLDLVPVEWSSKKEIVIPSIIHWKQDHFAAILEQKNDRYRVVDPTFEQTKWLRASEILEEASGSFMIPRAKLSPAWSVLTAQRTDGIFGRGRPPGTSDPTDGCGNGSGGAGGTPGSGGGGPGGGPGGAGGAYLGAANSVSGAGSGDTGAGGNPGAGLNSSCTGTCGSGGGSGDDGDKPCPPPCSPSGGPGNQGGGGFGGPGGSGGGPVGPGGGITTLPGVGMPVWKVSEPYITVWLYDRPLGIYQPGVGYPVDFKLAYKQRETMSITTGIFNFGKLWDCSWLSYVSFDGTNDPAPTMGVPGGGDRVYASDGVTREPFSDTRLQCSADSSQTNYIVSYPSGAKDYYGYVVDFQMQNAALLTDRVDPFGHTNHFVYIQTNSATLLQFVIDADGRTNTLFYTNANFPTRVTGVQDPFTHMAILAYDSGGALTNIIDAAGLTNSFKYDGALGWVTNLITPYGTTTFSYTTNNTSGDEFTGPGGPYVSEYFIIRSARIVDPAGGINIYTLRQDCNYLTNPITGDLDPFINGSTTNPLPSFPFPDVNIENNANLNYRNSFHWGPKQAAGLPADLNAFTGADHLKARRRHWCHDYSSDNISQSLMMEMEPSPDGITEGQMTWYAYEGWQSPPPGGSGQPGTNRLPAYIGRVRQEGGTAYTEYTWMQRDEWDRATNVVTTYSTGFAQSPLTRTNAYIYSGGDLFKHIGPRGETLEGYFYDGNHQLLRATNAVGDVWYYTYDSKGRLTNIKSPTGLNSTNIYFGTGDYANWVATNIDLEINRTNSYTYVNDLVSTHTDERGLTTTSTYDNLNRLTSVSDSRGAITYTYDKLDLTQAVDRMGFTNSYFHDAVRRMTNHTDPLGRSTLYYFCTCGALDSTLDAEGDHTYYFYDNAGRMTNVVYADGFSVTNLFNPLNEITNVIDSSGHSVSNWFNNQGLRYAVSTVSGNQTFIDFDDEDRATNVINSEGVSTATTYDNLGRLLARTYPDGGVESFGYAAAGLIAYTNQIGLTNFFVYDAAGRKTFETNANHELIRYTNNAAGDLLSLTDGKLQTTHWNYDQYGRVTNKLDQAGTEILRYKYDADNRLTNRWSRAKGDTYYSYNSVANLTNINYPASSDVSFAYDGLNRMTNMVDAIGTTKYTYSAAGQLLTEDGPFASDTVTNAYSNRLRTKLSLQQPTGLWTNSFAYDATKRLTNVTSSAGAFGYLYESGLFTHHPSRITLPNTAYITNAFDGNARLIATYLKNSGNAVLDSYGYIYNPANQRTNLARADSSTVAYQYDSIGQLTNADSSVNSEDRGYAYDAAWNLNSRNNNGTVSTFLVDNKNELTNAFSLPNGYDSNGNLTGANGSHNVYVYDDENRLIQWFNYQVSFSGPTTGDLRTDFFYDGLGRLRERLEYSLTCPVGGGGGGTDSIGGGAQTDSGGNNCSWVLSSETHYVYDGWRVIQERDGSNNPLVSYTRGIDLSGTIESAGGIGGLLAKSTTVANYYYFADGNGNITYMLNSSQTMVASYRYDPFGNTISSSGTLASANVYRFSSKEIQVASGMYYYGYRFYDPNLQRWINADPLGDPSSTASQHLIHHAHPHFVLSLIIAAFEAHGDLNLATFVSNNPTDTIDFLGLCDKSECNGYPPGILRFICKHTPCDAWSNCVRSCLAEHWDQGGKKNYACGIVPAHTSCWLGCAMDPGFEP